MSEVHFKAFKPIEVGTILIYGGLETIKLTDQHSGQEIVLDLDEAHVLRDLLNEIVTATS
jgi:3-keto-L-gulonate-6-phosphate decarboxylase